MRSEDLQLNPELLELWENLKKLNIALRKYRWQSWKRLDPFIESVFDRKEKGDFLGGQNVTIYDSTAVVGDVRIGDNTFIGQQCTLDGTGILRIGKHCTISTGTRVITHDTIKSTLTGGKAEYEYNPVYIEDYSFIGMNAVIIKGVRIGPHSVVGAGAVVTKDVPPYSIAAGVPARTIGKIENDGKEPRFIYY